MTPSHDRIKGNYTADPAARMVLNIFLGEDQNQKSHLNKMATALEYHHTEKSSSKCHSPEESGNEYSGKIEKNVTLS